MLNNSPRHKEVLKLVADKAGWGKKLPNGQGMGLALHESFGSWSAQVATVTVSEDGDISVDEIIAESKLDSQSLFEGIKRFANERNSTNNYRLCDTYRWCTNYTGRSNGSYQLYC